MTPVPRGTHVAHVGPDEIEIALPRCQETGPLDGSWAEDVPASEAVPASQISSHGDCRVDLPSNLPERDDDERMGITDSSKTRPL